MAKKLTTLHGLLCLMKHVLKKVLIINNYLGIFKQKAFEIYIKISWLLCYVYLKLNIFNQQP